MSDEKRTDEPTTEASVPDAPATVQPPRPPADPALSALTGEILDGNLDRPVEFTDFMFKLGLHYNLPGRAETTLEMPAFTKKRGTRIWLVALAVIVVIVGGAVPFLVRPEPLTTLPAQVLGEWETSTPKYKGRKLTLSENRVRIDFGDRVAAVEFPITEVRMRDTPEAVAFEVVYRQEKGLTHFLFSFHESTWPPSIQLPNPEGVTWVRARDVAAMREEARKAELARTRGIPKVR